MGYEMEIVGYLLKIKLELDASRIQPEEVVLDWIESSRKRMADD